MNCPKCGAGHRWITVDGDGDDEEIYCGLCGYGQETDPVETPDGSIHCLEPDCPNPPMIARMPGMKSNRWLHRYCFPCARKFYCTFTPALLVEAALLDFWKALKEN